ncbi:Hypothetical protein NTJ_14822 [Nesidiocoris tenuis]|uniref:Uncharacterized protein n=1 Tax=Nesidiocoris tenuis TaxID=355587 RepID=A0ABN7BCG9_9HEMI|nr:Hypothetical protein NTJ_14822 [Nesidiocoris tenuis]
MRARTNNNRVSGCNVCRMLGVVVCNKRIQIVIDWRLRPNALPDFEIQERNDSDEMVNQTRIASKIERRLTFDNILQSSF